MTKAVSVQIAILDLDSKFPLISVGNDDCFFKQARSLRIMGEGGCRSWHNCSGFSVVSLPQRFSGGSESERERDPRPSFSALKVFSIGITVTCTHGIAQAFGTGVETTSSIGVYFRSRLNAVYVVGMRAYTDGRWDVPCSVQYEDSKSRDAISWPYIAVRRYICCNQYPWAIFEVCSN